MSSFRKIFCPTKEELIENIEATIRIHKKCFNHCATCVFYIPTDMPGFVTDYGSCRLDCPIFSEKVCGHKDLKCSYYVEDVTEINRLEESLKDLKGENND